MQARESSFRWKAALAIALVSVGASWTVASTRGGPVQAGPTRPSAKSFAEQCREAELIFEGVVVDVRHRNSDVHAPTDVALPHTFAAFRVERVFKGRFDSDDGLFTLRVIGGPDGAGRTLHVSHAPTFEVGSREVLLVKNARVWSVPLVNGSLRRTRLTAQGARGEGGRPLELTPEGYLTIELDGVDEGPDRTHDHRALSAAGFRDIVARTVAATQTPAERALIPAVRSFAFDEPFSVAAPIAVAAPQAPVEPQEPALTEVDRIERELLERNGGDPVLRR